MKNIQKLKKKFVINTKYLEKNYFNEPCYIISSDKNSVVVYTITKQNIVTTKQINIDEKLSTKTFITIKDFFKKCTKDDTEFKIEKVDNGNIYIRVAYFNDLALFFKLGKKNEYILTNINKYKFYKTNNNVHQALNKANLSYYERERICGYLKNMKNVKRDYLYSIKQSLSVLQKNCEKKQA